MGDKMDAFDQEETDQHPDFRALLKPSKSTQALPTKDTKSGQDPAASLDDLYDTLFGVLSEERKAAEKTWSRAVYEEELGLFKLSQNRGSHFVSMGHTIHSQIYLFPEEALFLVDRGSLIVEHHGVDVTVQQMWCIYLSLMSQDTAHAQGTSLLQQHMAMERYLTYAHLKRLGFVVTRPGTYSNQGSDLPDGQSLASTALTRVENTPWWFSLWTRIFRTWKIRIRDTFSRIGLWLDPMNLWTMRNVRPLVSRTDQLSHDQILKRLQIIPSVRLSQSPYCDKSGSRVKKTVDFEVYKPAGPFKKRQPGIPNYRVVVTRADDPLPSLEDLSDRFTGQSDPAEPSPSGSPSTKMETTTTDPPQGKGKPTTNPAWPAVLYAVVDGGQVSFINIFNIKAIP